MNKYCYRVIFNKARNMLMVVAEIIATGGKSQQKRQQHATKQLICRLKPLTFLTYISLGLVSIVTQAQQAGIVVDKNAAANQRPTV